MKEIILDSLFDTLKLLPFLLIAFLLIEAIEHKFNKKAISLIEKSGKFGPIIGSFLGAFPQCGFSVFATNLYTTRIITMGTLIAIYLSTSDEMLPILLSNNVEFNLIIKILLIKILVGIIFGFIIDLTFKKKQDKNYELCTSEQCHCKDGIIKSSLKHTFNISIFILIVNLILNFCFDYFGSEYLSTLLLKESLFAPFITSLIGLIPNCASSVIITELYLNNMINFGSMIAGLLTGSGVAILVLFKTNKNLKENLKILSINYLIGVLIGIIIELF